MSAIRVPEINLTSDSEDLNEDNWFTSPTTSFDGSSINSIPWADDVIKQNKDEWENIERMFYGETELPGDEKLRSEIIEWTNRFPHMRVVGQQASIYYGENSPWSPANYEETFAIHPSSGTYRHQAVSHHSNNGNANARRMDVLHPVRESHSSLDEDFEKHLQITSRPLLTRRNLLLNQKEATAVGSSVTRSQYGKSRVTPNAVSESNSRMTSSALHSVRSSYDAHRVVNDSGEGQSNSMIHSARLVNVPALKMDTHAPVHRIIRINTANLASLNKPLRNSITLPSINIVPIYTEALPSHLIPNHGTMQRNRLPSGRAFKKRSESE